MGHWCALRNIFHGCCLTKRQVFVVSSRTVCQVFEILNRKSSFEMLMQSSAKLECHVLQTPSLHRRLETSSRCASLISSERSRTFCLGCVPRGTRRPAPRGRDARLRPDAARRPDSGGAPSRDHADPAFTIIDVVFSVITRVRYLGAFQIIPRLHCQVWWGCCLRSWFPSTARSCCRTLRSAVELHRHTFLVSHWFSKQGRPEKLRRRLLAQFEREQKREASRQSHRVSKRFLPEAKPWHCVFVSRTSIEQYLYRCTRR